MNAGAEGRLAMKAGRPRVLVYGAGVWGCLLRHALLQGGNAVALLCRGAWKRVVDERGLVIRHWGRLRATAESVPTVASLAPRDKYDVIFVAVRFTQIANVLEALAKNCSRHVVFVGNNPAAGATLSALRALSNAPREVAFGFQSSGGRREKESVAGIYARLGMTVGAVHGEMRAEMRALLERLFAGARYRLHFQRDMDAYLKCHAALILPVPARFIAAAGTCDAAGRTTGVPLFALRWRAMRYCAPGERPFCPRKTRSSSAIDPGRRRHGYGFCARRRWAAWP